MNRRSFFRRTVGAIVSAALTPIITKTVATFPATKPILEWTGFKPYMGDDKVVGQILYMGNLTVSNRRSMGVLYGISGGSDGEDDSPLERSDPGESGPDAP